MSLNRGGAQILMGVARIVAEQASRPDLSRSVFCIFMSLSAFIMCVATCIFWMHSYVIVLAVMLKTIKTGVFMQSDLSSCVLKY